MVLVVLALPTGRRPFQGRTSVLFPWVFAGRAQRLPQPPSSGTAGSAGGIAHGASMQVSLSALKPIPYRDDRSRFTDPYSEASAMIEESLPPTISNCRLTARS
jgi:hypothetical protein